MEQKSPSRSFLTKYFPLFLSDSDPSLFSENGDPPPHISYISGSQQQPSRSNTKTRGTEDIVLDTPDLVKLKIIKIDLQGEYILLHYKSLNISNTF